MNRNYKEMQLLKLNKYSRQYIDNFDKELDYQDINKQMREFSGAEYSIFYTFEENEKDFTLVGFDGNKSNIKKVMDIIGYNIVGKKFKYEENRHGRLESSIITKIESLKELVGSALPDIIISIMEKIFPIDYILVVRVTKDEETIGSFNLIFYKNQNKNDNEMLKLFASQIGLFINNKRYEQKTFESTKRVQSLLKNSVSIIVIFDNKGNYIDASHSAAELLGLKKEELIGKNFKKIIPEYKAEDFMNTITTINKTKQPLHKEDTLIVDGEERIYESIIFPIKQKEDEVVLFGSIANDITEKKEKEKEIIYLNFHDHLTGLYNRRFFEEELKRLDVERNLPLSIITIDVNGLKLINDTFGHNKGDETLIKSAKAIKNSLRADEIAARMGGDEFSIILTKCDESQANSVVKRIKENIEKESEKEIPFSLAIGAYTKTRSKEDISNILKNAESKMYTNKIFSDQSRRREAVLTILSTLHEKHQREEKHSKRVSQLAYSLGKGLEIKGDKLDKLKTAGLLHDIGKIAIDYSIIEKEGSLSDKEYKEIKKHPEMGYRILNSSMEYQDIAKIVLYHHEKIDGSGYPKGIKGNEIPIESKIISIVDAYDAMTSSRPYRPKGMSSEKAAQIIKENLGTQFDFEIGSFFIEEVIPEINNDKKG